jgi:hypothetical protein
MTIVGTAVYSIVGLFWLKICYQGSGCRGFAPVLLYYFFPETFFVLSV